MISEMVIMSAVEHRRSLCSHRLTIKYKGVSIKCEQKKV